MNRFREGSMKLYFLIGLITLTILGCNDDAKKTEGHFTYLGGEIISPINNEVILSYSDKIIDTLKLNSKNRFLYKLDDFEPGMYSFSLQAADGLEFQMVLLEPQDSIMLRLNTLDFDESLVYTGVGAKKNNYLINEFLQNEIDEKKVYKYCLLDPEDFEDKIDSLMVLKYKKLNAFKAKYKTSDLFNKVAKSNIDYSYYNSKEIYPIIHYRSHKNDVFKSIPDDFYSYRKNINYNDVFLQKDYNYLKFLRNSFNNLALNTHFEHSKQHHINRWNTCYNIDKMTLIDSVVSNAEIKNHLLYLSTINYVTKSKNIENNQAILNFYLSKSTNEENNAMINSYAMSINNLKAGDKLPSIKILDHNNGISNINALVGSPTVISFWSHKYYTHFKESRYKIKELKIKYPEVKFISININDCGLAASKKVLIKNHFSIQNEYQFKDPKYAIEALAIQPLTKTIIIDKHSKIVTSNTNLFSHNFEDQLLGLINR